MSMVPRCGRNQSSINYHRNSPCLDTVLTSQRQHKSWASILIPVLPVSPLIMIMIVCSRLIVIEEIIWVVIFNCGISLVQISPLIYLFRHFKCHLFRYLLIYIPSYYGAKHKNYHDSFQLPLKVNSRIAKTAMALLELILPQMFPTYFMIRNPQHIVTFMAIVMGPRHTGSILCPSGGHCYDYIFT